ncbi:atrial natriuretic peptide receptor 3-like [Liolophura sinensis]|uniref:atrial natriuretic peptide receptor 3-like n=1 Tax=Liolophura sinensis TaxID=3198878 RepID=UPI00315932D5
MVFSKEIKIATILPANDSRLFSIRNVAPAMEIAMALVSKSHRLLDGYTFSVKYEDSDCDIAEGINKAIKFYMQKEVNAFFGPVCDYALAPVSRQAIFWNIPVISAGGMAMDFTTSKLTEYRSLTRVGMFNFVSLCRFFMSVMNHFKWKTFKIIYDKPGQDSIVTGFCHLTTASIHYCMLAEAPEIQQSFYRLDQANSIHEMLINQVGVSSAGE